MKKFHNLKLFGLAGVIVLALVFIGINVVQAQVKTKGKPPGKGKPTKITCNNNLICESGEYKYELPHESQNCSDCLPKIYESLAIDPGLQIAGANFEIGKIFQFNFVNFDGANYNYVDTWACDKIEDIDFLHPEIGDIDGDGYKEIMAIATYKYKLGKGKKAPTYYDQKVFIFRDGDDGSLTETSSNIGYSDNYLWQTLLADIDSDGDDELILHKFWQTEIYKWDSDSKDFVLKWIEHYKVLCFRVEVGDADNDKKNELLIGTCDGKIHVLEYQGEDEGGNYIFVGEKTIDSSENYCIDRIRVKNTDDDIDNEVIVGGNNSLITIWKYNEGEYEQVFQSEDLGGYTEDFDIGDIDGDNNNEIVVAPVWTQTLYVLEYVEYVEDNNVTGTYEIVDSYKLMLDGGLKELSTGDFDQDGKDEVVFGGNADSVYIYRYDDNEFIKVYECVYGSRGGPRIK